MGIRIRSWAFASANNNNIIIIMHAQFCVFKKKLLREMRGLSSQFVQTAVLRLIQVLRKLRNCELHFAGFCRNCSDETAAAAVRSFAVF